MPTVVFHVSSATGTQPKEVHLSIDGGESASLDGRAISINPGPHEVSIGASGFQTATKRFVVTEGEKLRREAVTLAPLHEVHPIDHPLPHAKDTSANIRNVETGGRRITTSVIVATSAAALAGIGAVYFGVKARSDDRNLDSCAATSSCTREAVDQVRHEYIWTNVSIGVAIAGIATALVLYLVSDTPGKRTGKRTSTTAFGIGGAPDGASSVVTGRF